MLNHYVISWVRKANPTNHVLLILKDRPDWQKGRLNLPGGKVEEGETPAQAAVRELKEETGYEPVVPVRLLGTMQDGQHVIHCFKAVIATDAGDPIPRDGETEPVGWYSWDEVLKDPRLLPNLRVIIPLIQTGSDGWVIGDRNSERRTGKRARHVIKISIPTYYESESE